MPMPIPNIPCQYLIYIFVKDLLIVRTKPQEHLWKHLLLRFSLLNNCWPRFSLLRGRSPGLLDNHCQTVSLEKTYWCYNSSTTSEGEMLQHFSFQGRQLVFYFFQSQYYMIMITHTFVCEGVWGYSLWEYSLLGPILGLTEGLLLGPIQHNLTALQWLL